MRTYKDFEDFLNEKFYQENPSTLDDQWPDMFSDWLSDIDSDTWIKYGNQYAKVCNPF
jgi:hypothetical protein